MTIRLFIFGAGYSGRAIARKVIAEAGHAAGTTRSPEKAEELRAQGIEAFLFDTISLSSDIAKTLRETTHLIASIAPDHGMRERNPSSGLRPPSPRERGEGEAATLRPAPFSPFTGRRCRQGDEGQRQGETDDAPAPVDPVLSAARGAIAEKMPALRWIGYLSTVGVYGDHGGAWVDEATQCRPVSHRSLLRLQAEREWLSLGDEVRKPVAILRLSGIYGPGRNGFVNLEKGTARRIVKPGQVFNRIHVDDIAGATLLLAARERGGVFNVTDDEPAPPQDVVAFAASLMGVAPPPEIAFEEARMTPMARSFYGENKRVSNAKLKAQGYRFAFPDHRAALSHLWESGEWRGRPAGADARSKIRQ